MLGLFSWTNSLFKQKWSQACSPCVAIHTVDIRVVTHESSYFSHCATITQDATEGGSNYCFSQSDGGWSIRVEKADVWSNSRYCWLQHQKAQKMRSRALAIKRSSSVIVMHSTNADLLLPRLHPEWFPSLLKWCHQLESMHSNIYTCGRHFASEPQVFPRTYS